MTSRVLSEEEFKKIYGRDLPDVAVSPSKDKPGQVVYVYAPMILGHN
jgi:hypothetical protein